MNSKMPKLGQISDKKELTVGLIYNDFAPEYKNVPEPNSSTPSSFIWPQANTWKKGHNFTVFMEHLFWWYDIIE